MNFFLGVKTEKCIADRQKQMVIITEAVRKGMAV